MARKEKFGKFVLLDEIDATAVGQEYRAAKLGTGGLEKIVSVLKLKPALCANADVVKSLMDQVKFAAQLQNPNILKIYGIGKVEQAYYISYEFLEGKSLRSVFARCRQEGFPFSIDHALLITSKVCSALEFAHGRRTEGGARYFHGRLTPASVLVSYEGEVRVRDFGVWPSRVREAGGSAPEDVAYLAPEQAQADGGEGGGDTRSDIYAAGTLLFETLTGEPFATPQWRPEAGPRLAKARLQNPVGDDDALPKPILEILHRALASDPGARYAEVQEMRKAVDTLLFSGDFTPTTFNLAFFMHSLFREDIERETKALKEEKEASYFEFLAEEPSRTAAAPARPVPAPPPAVDLKSLGITSEPPAVRDPSPVSPAAARASVPPATPTPLPTATPPARSQGGHAPLAPMEDAPPVEALPVRDSFTVHEEPKSRLPLIAAAAVAAVLLAGGGWYALRGRGAVSRAATPPPPSTLSAAAMAAAAKIEELEEKLRQLESERAAAETAAADEAKRKVEQQAAARGQAADAAAIQRAQEEARRKAQEEQTRRQEEERRRLEEERRAEEVRLAEERRRAEEEAARLAAAAATTLPPPPPTTVPPKPAVQRGQLVTISEPGVIGPVVTRQVNPVYPPIAMRQNMEGTVELNVLVDENGNVTDAKVLSSTGGRVGFDEAAIDSVKQRKYRPATKEGVPVKVWVPVRVVFKRS